MRRTTLILIALSFVLAALVMPSAARAAAPSPAPAPAAQASPADAGIGGGLVARFLGWLVEFALAPADNGGKPAAPAPATTSDQGDVIPTADPNG